MMDRRRLLLGSVAAALTLSGCAGEPERSEKRSEKRPTKRTGHLKVPGTELYYDVRGSGPPLLMIHGGVGDSGAFAAITPHLAKHFTVIRYDRRGNSRSRLTGPPAPMRVPQQSDDAAQVVDRFSDEPPYVFGSSGGAIVALELAARYGANLRTVVAHEPPVSEVLPDAERWRRAYEETYQTYQDHGTADGFAKFMAIDPGQVDPEGEITAYPEDPEFGRRIQPNQEFMLAYEMLPFIHYQPRIAALKKLGERLVVGVGHYKAKMMTRVCTTLAKSTGARLVEFPGDHTGYMPHPEEFDTKLREVLS